MTINLDHPDTGVNWDHMDAIERFLETRTGQDFNASQIARGIKAGAAHTVYTTLDYMVAHAYIAASGNGMRTRYQSRRA